MGRDTRGGSHFSKSSATCVQGPVQWTLRGPPPNRLGAKRALTETGNRCPPRPNGVATSSFPGARVS